MVSMIYNKQRNINISDKIKKKSYNRIYVYK